MTKDMDRRPAVRAANYLITGDKHGSRATRLAATIADRVLEKEGSKVTGKLVAAIVAVLVVVVLAFVAYRLLMVEIILDLVRERA
ncbi:hypothetical protein [Paractinoplanes atraurantiacus]|uniref:Uncharacterized protein n=1 Tax=Paractinoplanes atraurantiacus TaxID=1036182 RepID=A0A285K573_9ACTN|nr:hypothetical protein [Actinoplanes atraurantiacus]SNY67714.1 hypothetical protein SAMN05421748_13211 [Actinoplanes atraurantiacus]